MIWCYLVQIDNAADSVVRSELLQGSVQVFRSCPRLSCCFRQFPSASSANWQIRYCIAPASVVRSTQGLPLVWRQPAMQQRLLAGRKTGPHSGCRQESNYLPQTSYRQLVALYMRYCGALLDAVLGLLVWRASSVASSRYIGWCFAERCLILQCFHVTVILTAIN